MHVFTDSQGRTWDLLVHVTAQKRVRARLGWDLYSLVEDGAKGFEALLSDPVKLVDLLFVLCQEQGERLGVSDEDFGRAFTGDVLDAAGTALVEELIDFFPPRLRQTLRGLAQKGRETALILTQRAEAEVASLDPASLAARFIASSGGSPDNSPSTPDRSPSANSA